MNYEEIEDNREMYQERLDEETPDGVTLGTVILPDEDSSEEALDLFHDLMMNEGFVGIEYVQEALHTSGGDYFDRIFDEPEDAREDFEQYKEFSDE